MSLFDEAETSADPSALELDLNDVASYRRKKYKVSVMKEEVFRLCSIAHKPKK